MNKNRTLTTENYNNDTSMGANDSHLNAYTLLNLPFPRATNAPGGGHFKQYCLIDREMMDDLCL